MPWLPFLPCFFLSFLSLFPPGLCSSRPPVPPATLPFLPSAGHARCSRPAMDTLRKAGSQDTSLQLAEGPVNIPTPTTPFSVLFFSLRLPRLQPGPRSPVRCGKNVSPSSHGLPVPAVPLVPLSERCWRWRADDNVRSLPLPESTRAP